ncbi:MAG TPA: hypothetical protein VJ741_09090 [Solirubrobacteraceae bacterium]|nr:hypothetical protein [Solirubrobacteraceae bacterium]
MSIHPRPVTEREEAWRRNADGVYDRRDDDVSGWLAFAGVLLLIVGSLNVIQGIAAISGSRFFVHDTHYVFANLNTWGWIALCVGAVQVVVGLGAMVRNQLARWSGIVVLSLAALMQLLMAPAYPFWAITLFAVNIIAVYALAAHGERGD